MVLAAVVKCNCCGSGRGVYSEREVIEKFVKSMFHYSCFFFNFSFLLGGRGVGCKVVFLTPEGPETIFKPFLKFGQAIVKAIVIKNS
jgi:hypothetical protein